jgi:alpha/beta superfamily hydrolase
MFLLQFYTITVTISNLALEQNLQDDSILVDLADAITKEGISAFRFDFSGNG